MPNDLGPEKLRELLETTVPFVRRAGLKALELAPGRVKLLMPFAGNENHIGIMYAGALFTLAEVPGGALFLTTFDIEKYYPVVKEINIRFRRPATGDVTIEVAMAQDEIGRINAEVEAGGKSEFILEGQITDGQGQVAAIARGVYQIRKHGS
ncbi:Thioesterase putative [Desulfarculus baarsii DSM 2075]|uniref:Thioesterase putative n=1 Tax=Desulfarculus baarsii (strain ATCC 33931 / DSM 2075 / LMG 7858 / VKM B-1802 / 2st14) TaxID=644282 RepID=E1QF36_DESB2|nr:YiiD C-terminal domain-containing protein [Desulfarculus baarsii]ADK84172.1 Thioesterase putative [Desulfarculus baarsii DSM 2075]